MIPDGEVRSINFGGEIETLYILLALELLSRKTEKDISEINLPPSRTLAFMDEATNSFNIKLNNQSSIPNFDGYISQEAKAKVDDLKNLIGKAKKAQEEKERMEVMEKPISNKKVDEFWDLFVKEFYRNVTFRSLFKRENKFIDNSNEDPGSNLIDLIGYNQIDLKEGFLEDWYVSYVGWGERYGEGFARSEDNLVYKQMTEKLKNRQTILVSDFIINLEETLQKNKFSKPFIFTTYDYDIETNVLRSSEKFIPRWSPNRDHKGYDKYGFYIGFLETKNAQIPIFRMVGIDEVVKNACLVDMDKVGIFIQFPPIKTLDDKKFQRDIFMYKIIDLNADTEKRQQILKENPSWLKEKSDPESYLKDKVLVNIYSKFEFKITDAAAGVYFEFSSRQNKKGLKSSP
jgi:hypothetical protein